MDAISERRGTLIAVGIVVLVSILVGLTFMGGQTSKILSTVGAAIDNPAGGIGAAPGPGSDPGSGSGSGAGGSEVADAGATVPTLLIVRTDELVLQVPDLDAALRDGEAAVLRSGGYVSASSRSAEDGRESAQVTYRIPSAAWDTTLAALRRLASSIVSEQLKTDEVTGQVVDLTARIANLRAAEAALQDIMARAAKISDVLDVQKQLTATRGEIEKAVADKAHLVDQASYGSLAVTYRLPAVPAPTRTPVPAKAWDPGNDVAQASGRLVAIGQTTTSVGIWLAIVGLPVAIGALILLVAIWQVFRLGRWVVGRRRDAAISPGT
jgi:hypothetical protein